MRGWMPLCEKASSREKCNCQFKEVGMNKMTWKMFYCQIFMLPYNDTGDPNVKEFEGSEQSLFLASWKPPGPSKRSIFCFCRWTEFARSFTIWWHIAYNIFICPKDFQWLRKHTVEYIPLPPATFGPHLSSLSTPRNKGADQNVQNGEPFLVPGRMLYNVPSSCILVLTSCWQTSSGHCINFSTAETNTWNSLYFKDYYIKCYTTTRVDQTTI